MKHAIQAISHEVARLLLRAGSIHVSRERPFILASGWASPVYVDVRSLIGEPEFRRTISVLAIRYAQAHLAESRFDAVAGAETAGIPFAALFADANGLKLRYVRKRPLGVGRNAQVEGGDVDGLNVLLMDDITTDGNSKLNFARGLRAAGAIVTDVLTIFYHDAFPGAGERLMEAGLKLHALATWGDILVSDTDNVLSDEDRTEIKNFLADPIAWSTRHGGRSNPALRS